VVKSTLVGSYYAVIITGIIAWWAGTNLRELKSSGCASYFSWDNGMIRLPIAAVLGS
jgi:hypothetical protein